MTNTEYPSYEYRNNLNLKTTMQINGFENSNPRIKQTLTKPNRFGGIKDWLDRNRDNVPEWGDISFR
jgi:hypothetical protein